MTCRETVSENVVYEVEVGCGVYFGYYEGVEMAALEDLGEVVEGESG
jgi:hypothetical protein